VRHAGDATLDEFRAKAREYLGQKDHFVIINYLRMAIGQERGGHISPLAPTMPRQIAFSFLTSPVTNIRPFG